MPAAAACAASPDCERRARAAWSKRFGRRTVGPALAEGGGEGWVNRGVLAVWGEKWKHPGFSPIFFYFILGLFFKKNDICASIIELIPILDLGSAP